MSEAIAADTAAGVPAELAARAAGWPYLHTAFDIVEVARARGRTPVDTARVYWGLFDLLDLGWFWDRIGLLPRSDRWQNHARAGLRDDFLNELRALADDALRAGDVFTPVGDVVERWAAGNERAVGPVAHGARRDPRRRRVRPHDAVGGAAPAAQRRAGQRPCGLVRRDGPPVPPGRLLGTVGPWPWSPRSC